MAKHCPYCRHLVHVEHGAKGGACDRCNHDFTVKYHLSKIRLNKIFIPRDYDAEVMAYVLRKGQTYAGEISCHVGASKGVVSQVLRRLESSGAVKVIPKGKTKWILLPDVVFKYR